MFYSHEILTSRKYGVATVWLVATLGAKSSTKKVTRKAILGVDLKKACETIIEPEAPMALRLQSNLLYGVSKVYNQQWEYLLSDVQAAQNNIRALLKAARSDGLDPNAGKARRDQLIMMDDPAFSADMALPDLGFDLDRALTPSADTQRSSQSMLSIRGRSGSVSSLHAVSVLGLDIASSSNGGNAYQLPPHPDFFRAESSAQKGKATAGGNVDPFGDEELILFDDDLFDFDQDGQLRDISASERESRRLGSVVPQSHRDSEASGRVREDHEDTQLGHILPILDGEGDFDMMNYGDDDLILPDAEPFPFMAGRSDPPEQARAPSSPEGEPSSVSAEAPVKQKRNRVKKVKFIRNDQAIALRNAELGAMQREYLDHMAAETLINTNKKAVAKSKANAFHHVYGSGINGIGEGLGSLKLPSPLEMFSGEALMLKLTGKSTTKSSAKNSSKRPHANEEDEHEEGTPNKRARSAEEEIGRGNQIQFQDDDNFILNNNDNHFLPDLNNGDADASMEIERGRDAPSALADYPSSAMPWNVSASLHSHQRAASSSIPGRLGSRRLTSASPLIGRGSALPGDLQLDDLDMGVGMGDDDVMVMYGRSDRSSSQQLPSFAAMGFGIKSSSVAGVNPDEFEVFGAAAAVDTQTAADSQWLRSALDTESNNFLEYVKNTIDEKGDDELSQDEDDLDQIGGAGVKGGKSITFEELFDPEKNTCMVAAQAFYHVLSLATKKRAWVEQDCGMDGMEPWGEIRIGVFV
ncbi:related to meiotic cohesin rec8 [Phialocephala subalpina]|uniref:Related to meiotic cohesin rec8 n=1 Tax=Phialocephala subalpina TaxID=576137 RepID=A0A1L7WFE6_9HELO|nr:related to meiotic cohesin rec8 [Phialocephala subalpina]